MNVTRTIVEDLLPLYVAGEASADSCAAVEAALRDDPTLAKLVEALRSEEPELPPPMMPPDAERSALEQARTLLRRRTWLLALALFLSGLPLSFVFGSEGLQFWLIRDAPVAGWTIWAAAAGLWIAFGAVSRRVRVTGL